MALRQLPGKQFLVGRRRLLRFRGRGSTGLNSSLAGFFGDHGLSKSLSRSSWVTLEGMIEANRVRLTVSNSSTFSRLSSGSTSEARVSITGESAVSTSEGGEATDSPQPPQKWSARVFKKVQLLQLVATSVPQSPQY